MFSETKSCSSGIGREPCRALTPVAWRTEESKDPARTAAAALPTGLCPSICLGSCLPWGFGRWLLLASSSRQVIGSAAGDTGARLALVVWVAAKREVTALPHPDSPPQSISFQPGDAAGESHPLAPRARTGRGSSCRCFREETPPAPFDQPHICAHPRKRRAAF